MKIIYLIGVFSVLLISCKKDYTCDCTYNTDQQMYDPSGNPFGSAQTAETSSSTTIHDKKDAAKTECEGNNGTVNQTTNAGGYTTEQTVTTNCSLK